MKIIETRRKIALIIAIAVIALVAVYAVFRTTSENPNIKYHGLTLQIENDYSEEEITYIKQRIDLTKSAIEAQENAGDVDLNLYFSLALDYSTIGDLVGARETYEKFFELNSIDYTAWSNYGTVLKKMGDNALAEDAYLQAIQLKPIEANYRNLIDLLESRYPDGSRDADVLRALEEGVEKVGQTSWFMVHLAEWYVEHGKCEQAFKHYNVAKTLSPDITAIADDLKLAKETCVEVN